MSAKPKWVYLFIILIKYVCYAIFNSKSIIFYEIFLNKLINKYLVNYLFILYTSGEMIQKNHHFDHS